MLGGRGRQRPDAGNEDWYYGVHRTYLQELIDYWRRRSGPPSTLGRAGAADELDHTDNHGHWRTAEREVGHAGRR